jgi:hypothetical protein
MKTFIRDSNKIIMMEDDGPGTARVRVGEEVHKSINGAKRWSREYCHIPAQKKGNQSPLLAR